MLRFFSVLLLNILLMATMPAALADTPDAAAENKDSIEQSKLDASGGAESEEKLSDGDKMSSGEEEGGSAEKRQKTFDPDELLALFPSDTISVNVLTLSPSPRLHELSVKIQAAAKNDPVWWMAHVKKAEKGGPLPYDTKLGITQDEYSEFLALAGKVTAKKVAEANLKVSKEDRVIKFDGLDGMSDLSGIELDLDKDLVRTRDGVIDESTAVRTGSESVLGAWVGRGWRHRYIDPTTGSVKVLAFAVGKLLDSGRTVLQFDVKRASGDEAKVHGRIITFDMPAPKPLADDSLELGVSYCYLGALFASEDFTSEADSLFDKSMPILTKSDDPELLKRCSELLRRIKKDTLAEKLEKRIKDLETASDS